jgi:hypothetical protein
MTLDAEDISAIAAAVLAAAQSAPIYADVRTVQGSPDTVTWLSNLTAAFNAGALPARLVADQSDYAPATADDAAEILSAVNAMPSATAAALAGTVDVNVYAPASGRSLDLYGKDAYASADGRAILVTKIGAESHWPTTLSTVDFYAEPTADTVLDAPAAASLGPVSCTVVTATGTQAFRLELTVVQLATLTPGAGAYAFAFVANRATRPATLRSGRMTVRAGPAGL